MANRARSEMKRKYVQTDERRLQAKGDEDAASASIAAYIAEITGELATLAGRGNLPMLAYFLNLARVEAQIYVRENGCQEISRER
jgi:NTP pyrophosphatase (non-canonical NTP hydrolase)